jgi:EAL domain-containing protein (putative c-di-GMP-specific phosphodiesterase class I)/CHASE2 domain-containing sensor protein
VTARVLRSLLARERLLACLVGAAVALALLSAGMGAGLEKFCADLRAGFAVHRPSGSVVIVEIDGKSIAAFHRWPWPRSIHGALVDRLRESGARLIAFDVDFSSASDPGEDAAFAAALERAGRGVLLPTFIQEASFGGGASMESAPIPSLADNSFLAAANVLPDRDGQLRRMPFGFTILGAPRPSIPAMVAERQGQVGGSFAIDLRLDPSRIPRFSAVDVAEGRVPTPAFRGKRVIVGATAVELVDRYAVPGHGILPGVVVQAMAAETLLAGRGYGEGSALWGLVLALAGLAAALTPRRPVARVLFFAGAAAAILFLPSATQHLAQVSLPIVPALAALLAGGLAAGARALAARDRERGLVDGETGLCNLAALTRDAAGEEDVTVGVMRIDRAAERLSAGGGEEVRALLLRLAERLRFAAAPRVYRIDAGALAWLGPATPGEDPLPALAHLLRAAAAGDTGQELQLHFGAASGRGADAAALAARAALAAGEAAARGVATHIFTQADGEAVRREEALLARFDSALAEGQIHIAYQPKRNLATGRFDGVEALARWQDPALGAVAPDVFIPLLERHGRIADLTARILADALEDVKGWNGPGRPFSVAVNVSAALLHDAGAMLRLRQIFLASGVPGGALVVEVTETAAMSDTPRAVASLHAWRELGAAVSIDDYGTGHSSLGYLQSLPATEIKIDRSFVSGLATDRRRAIMVKSTIAMAHELGLAVVAEGVEDESTLAALRAMGCDTAQGYAIARPAPAAEITRLLAAEASARHPAVRARGA